MYILQDGKVSFLEFLRNLTPQAILLYMFMFYWNELRSDFFSLFNLLMYFVSGFVFTFAFLANLLLFVDRYLRFIDEDFGFSGREKERKKIRLIPSWLHRHRREGRKDARKVRALPSRFRLHRREACKRISKKNSSVGGCVGVCYLGGGFGGWAFLCNIFSF